MIDCTAGGARRAVEDSLQRMAVGHVDIVHVHAPSRDMFGDAEFEHYFRIAAGPGDAFEELVRMREEGIIKAWGLGVNTVEPCMRTLQQSDPDIFLLAGRYTLMETTPLSSLFPSCASRGAHVVLGGPFNSGFLTGGSHYDHAPARSEQVQHRERLRQVAARHHVDLATAALQFGLGHPVVVATIPGASSAEHLRRNAGLMRIEIPEAFWGSWWRKAWWRGMRRCRGGRRSPFLIRRPPLAHGLLELAAQLGRIGVVVHRNRMLDRGLDQLCLAVGHDRDAALALAGNLAAIDVFACHDQPSFKASVVRDLTSSSGIGHSGRGWNWDVRRESY